MWTKSENSESVKPLEFERTRNGVIIRRDFHSVEATEERAAHWEFEEAQLTNDQYEIYQVMKAENDELSDALIELAEIVVGG